MTTTPIAVGDLVDVYGGEASGPFPTHVKGVLKDGRVSVDVTLPGGVRLVCEAVVREDGSEIPDGWSCVPAPKPEPAPEPEPTIEEDLIDEALEQGPAPEQP